MKFDLLRRQDPAYAQISDEENGEATSPKRTSSSISNLSRILLALLLAVLAVCGYAHWLLRSPQSRESRHGVCETVSTRQEWRTLTMPQKHEYLSAVQCLKTKPSRLGKNHTLYDDFPWVHSQIGSYVHDAAPFLTWHRYFVHIYESTLKEQCGYTGNMPFWDWQLDWQDVTKAPIWDGEHGFGTNGDSKQSERAIVKGYCVADGPFKNFVIPYLDEKHYPHCLSRGFAEGAELKNQSAMLNPEVLDNLLSLNDYDAFNIGLENGPHLAIPRSIRGDFSLLTAPSDPVFFLHHTQLDRLWWKWQSRHPDRRLEYAGAASHHSQERASVDDLLLMGGLAPDIAVSRVLDTHGGVLCYQY